MPDPAVMATRMVGDPLMALTTPATCDGYSSTTSTRTPVSTPLVTALTAT